jgi:hypothetical protein
MKADQQPAHQSLSVLEPAEALGNISEACRRRDISRTRLYEYKRRSQPQRIEGIKDPSPIQKPTLCLLQKRCGRRSLPKPFSPIAGVQPRYRAAHFGGDLDECPD